MKYQIFSVLFLLILILGCKKEIETKESLLTYVPANSSLVIKINDFQKFKDAINTNNFISKLIQAQTYTGVVEKIKALTYLNPESESILIFSEFKNDDFDFTFITKKNQNLVDTDRTTNKVIEEINGSYKKYSIEDLSFYSKIIDSTIIISSTENYFGKLENKTKNDNFAILNQLYEIADATKPASALINLNQANPFLHPSIKDHTIINEFSDWVLLDIDVADEHINFNGISIANDSLSNHLSLFKNTNPLTNSTPLFAPINADAILSYTYNNHNVFAENQKAFMKEAPKDSLLNTVEEIGFIYLNNRKAILLNTYGAINISEYLSGVKKETFDYQGNEIVEIIETDFLNKRLRPIIKNYTSNFYTIIEDAFIFTENIESLQTIISNYKNGNTFNKSDLYTSAMTNLAEESTILYISNTKNINNTLKSSFSNSFYKDIKKVTDDSYLYASQAIADKNFYHTNLIIQKIEKENKTTKVDALFSFSLDADIANLPQFVTNHISNKKEIIVQDVNHTLYLISRKGEIVWKKELNSGIQGKIHQVDIFKNGRLQLAFTTNNQLLVLDRDGKEVSQFTKTYEGGNLNPLAVFDYEGKKDYRFIVTQAEKIFMYNNKAVIVDGFKYTKANKPILSAPKHLKIKSKDFIVFKLEDGSLKIVSRVGDVRTKVSPKIDFSKNEIFIYKNKFTLTDKKGTLYQIDEKGEITKTNLNLSNDHGLFATSKTLAIMNDNILSIRGKKVELELGVYTQPEIFYIYDKIYVAVTDIQHQQVYLYDSQAKPISSLPVHGTSKIELNDVDNDKKLEFVTKENDNTLTLYKVN